MGEIFGDMTKKEFLAMGDLMAGLKPGTMTVLDICVGLFLDRCNQHGITFTIEEFQESINKLEKLGMIEKVMV